MTSEAEIMVEIDQNLGEEGVKSIEEEIKKFPMVEGVEYWTGDRTEAYIDRMILPGYRDFLLKTGAVFPIKPLFRIQIADFSERP